MKKQSLSKQIKTMFLMLISIASLLLFIYFIMILSNLEQRDRYPGRLYYPYSGNYDINPESILADLERGEEDVFKPISATPEVYSYLPTGSFPWHQADYLNIAHALHQYTWKENLDGWRLYSMHFFRGCQDNPVGFDSGEFIYFRGSNALLDYETRILDIYPTGGTEGGVSWAKANYPRSIFGWKNIKLEKLEVTADDCLQTAEKNGGKKERLMVSNDCEIHVSLSPNSDYTSDWNITYYNNGYVIFEMNISPYIRR